MRKKDVLTTGQVAQLCNVAPRTVTKWFDSGQLGGYRIPGSKDRRIPQNELIRFMKAHDIPTGELENGNIRILIIDSRIEYVHQYSDQLRTQGRFEIQCAHNSFDAGLAVLKFSPNIIMVDLMSSDIDAVSLCGYVHESDEIQDCTLIALAGGLNSNEVQNLKNQGFDAVVTDPENMNTVLTCIRQGCEPRHSLSV
jgi:excisionase family DNA binding protein